MIYFEAPHVTIHWDEMAQAVFAEWHGGPLDSIEFRAALNHALVLLIEREARNWLADLRKFAYPSVEDREWSINEWFPCARKAGIARLALVMPDDELERVSVYSRTIRMANDGVTTAYFATVDEAKEWLMSAK